MQAHGEHGAPGTGAHSGHEHAAEAFPRLAVRDLIEADLRSARRRERLQEVAFSVALAALALAFPATRLLGDGPPLVQATERGAWCSIYVVLQPLAALLARIPGVGAEDAWYLISAAGWAAAYPVLSRMAQGLGASRWVASLAASIALASPLAVLSATLPGPSGVSCFGSALLFRELLREPGERRRLRPLAVWLGVVLLDPGLVALLPAVVWRLLFDRETPQVERARTLGLALAALALAAGVMGAAALAGQDELQLAAAAKLFGRVLLGKSGTNAPDALTWVGILLPALGVGLLGLIELLRRPALQGPPPRWIAVFVAVPVVARLLGGAPGLETGAWILGPVVACGLVDCLGRERERWHRSTMLALTGLQVLLSVGFLWIIERRDPNRAWMACASRLLETGDLVIVRDPQHEYLLRHRFHVQTVNLRAPHELEEAARADWWNESRERVSAQARAGGRVAVDWKADDPPGGPVTYLFQRELHELVLLAPVRYLDPQENAVDEREKSTSPDEL